MYNNTLMKKLLWAGALLSFATMCSCTMIGSPSLTLLANDLPASSKNIKVIANKTKETESITWVWCMAFGKSATHESVAKKLMDRYSADVLLDAQFTTFTYGLSPLIFQVIGTSVEGTPAKFVDGGKK